MTIDALIQRAWRAFARYERSLTDAAYHAYLDARERAATALSTVPKTRRGDYEPLP